MENTMDTTIMGLYRVFKIDRYLPIVMLRLAPNRAGTLQR